MNTVEQDHVWLSLGSNLGDRMAYLRNAVAATDAISGVCIQKVSSVYDTSPWGPKDQPSFLNIVVEINCSRTPAGLLSGLLAVERIMGRERRALWYERTLDIDIILFGSLVINEEKLHIPHPRYHERRFVLVPMVEIAADVRDPRNNLTMRRLLDLCDDTGIVEIIASESDVYPHAMNPRIKPQATAPYNRPSRLS
jgi:2-amino-4-hydroxy-6-hydroxymethyldihydropteridine diphosphokinase